MCKSGGFHLTKFIPNNKALWLSATEHHRKMGVKDQDLPEHLPNEKTLGICWNLGENIFSFKLKMEVGTLTKRVMLSMINSIYDPLGFVGLCNQDIQWDSEFSGAVKKYWRNCVT